VAEKAAQAAARSVAAPGTGAAPTEASVKVATRRSRSVTASYVLGIAVQVLFWCLVFLALAVAIGVGGHLTEFRYVGF
jgi:hypothetical protein